MSSLAELNLEVPASREMVAARSASAVWGARLVVLIVALWGLGVIAGFKAALGLLVALGFLLAGSGLFVPAVGLYGVTMLATLDAPSRVYLMGGGLLRWNSFNYWLLLVMAVGLPCLLRCRDPHTRLLQLFITLLLAEIPLSPELTPGVLHALNVVTMFGLLIYFRRAARDERVWLWAGLVNGVLAAVGGMVFYLQRGGLRRIDENALSYFPLTALFLICLGFAAAGRRPGGQLALGGLAVVNGMWVFLTGSRGGTLVATLCFLYLFAEVRGLGRRVVLMAAAVLIGLGIAAQFSDLQERTLHRFDKMLDSDYSATKRTSGRYDLAIGGWRIFLDHPLGVGTGGFRHMWAHLELREGLSDFGEGEEKSAHCGWLKVLSENGLPGFGLLAAYVGSFAWVGWRRGRVGLLAAAILSVAFISTEFQNKGLWLLAAGATVRLHPESRRSGFDPSP